MKGQFSGEWSRDIGNGLNEFIGSVMLGIITPILITILKGFADLLPAGSSTYGLYLFIIVIYALLPPIMDAATLTFNSVFYLLGWLVGMYFFWNTGLLGWESALVVAVPILVKACLWYGSRN